jgi:serine/threonine protein kinase
MTPDVPARLSAALADRYRIGRELGAGGMATVYLAEDLKHDRKVAIKVLKPELAAVLGADRFVQEIKTTAQLQHPHILPLHDSGTADGFLFYVMPYIEGETLRDKLDRETQLGVDEAVRITREVADALDYAHRHGIIHRDIKPENILLHDGRPMVADFGIALAVSAAAGGRMTETGTSVGTPHYMSPEQATADREITGRADIYSLASVLYEMLAGEPPHTGASAQAVIMKIIADVPRPLTELRKSVPPNVAAAVMKALEKLPADRFESAMQFAEALANPAFGHTATATSAGTDSGSSLRNRWISRAGWALAVVFGALAFWPRGAGVNTAGPGYAFQVDLVGANGPDLRFMNDGSLLYSPSNTIYRRRPEADSSAILLSDPRQIITLSPSPDGQWVAFNTFGDNQEGVYKVPTAGGPRQTLFEGAVDGSRGLVWARDGWIYFASGDVFVRVREDGAGALDTVMTAPDLAIQDLLPTGDLLLAGGASLVAFDPASGDTSTVLETTGRPTARWSPTGHLVYWDGGGALLAVPFDPGRRRVTGEPKRVLDGVATNAPRFAISDQGALGYLAGAAGVPRYGRSDYVWVYMDGRRERIPIETVAGHSDARLSPDFTRLAYIRTEQLHVFDLDLGSDVRVGTANHDPVWSPDGSEIAARDDSRDAIVAVAADGSRSRVIVELAATSPLDWLADGTILIEPFRPDDLYGIRDEPEPVLRPLLTANWEEHGAGISPDGRWLAYASTEDGAMRGYLRAWPDLSRRTLVTGTDTLSGGHTLYWSDDARTLYYQRANYDVVATTIGTDGTASRARVLFNLRGGLILGVDHPRSRFLFRQSAVGADDPDGLPEPNRVVVITNWFAELQRRLGIDP